METIKLEITKSEPASIEQVGPKELGITWKDGHRSIYPSELLREECPCAGCVDEITRVRKIKPGDIPSDIHPIQISPVGRYAIHILWSDGHDSGIYTFDHLRSLCPCGESGEK